MIWRFLFIIEVYLYRLIRVSAWLKWMCLENKLRLTVTGPQTYRLLRKANMILLKNLHPPRLYRSIFYRWYLSEGSDQIIRLSVYDRCGEPCEKPVKILKSLSGSSSHHREGWLIGRLLIDFGQAIEGKFCIELLCVSCFHRLRSVEFLVVTETKVPGWQIVFFWFSGIHFNSLLEKNPFEPEAVHPGCPCPMHIRCWVIKM